MIIDFDNFALNEGAGAVEAKGDLLYLYQQLGDYEAVCDKVRSDEYQNNKMHNFDWRRATNSHVQDYTMTCDRILANEATFKKEMDKFAKKREKEKAAVQRKVKSEKVRAFLKELTDNNVGLIVNGRTYTFGINDNGDITLD